MHPDDVTTLLTYPRTMIATDGAIESPGEGHPHPRSYGTYPRVLGHYVRELRALPLHRAIHKMTGMPADRIGLNDRGRLVEGALADIVVFHPDEVIDRSTFTDPHRQSEGVDHLWVAGEAVMLDKRLTGRRPGRILRSSAYTGSVQP